MSTVPKLTYAKVGKGSKAKAESVSSELLRSNNDKADDIFSHMNQANLNYIKKQLKLKKNRSEHQPSRSPEREQNEGVPDRDEEVTQRNKLYQKYRGEEEVSEKEPHLQDTQRRSQSEQVMINLPEDIEEDYQPSDHHHSKPHLAERQFLATSHHGVNPSKMIDLLGDHKMYQSVPYEDGKKRIASIEGYFGQAISTNLNRQEGLFIQFLEEYICDLNQSKHLKTRENEGVPMEKRRKDGQQSQRKRTVSREGEGMRKNSKVDIILEQDQKKLDRLNRNSDTYAEANSKYTTKSHRYRVDEHREDYLVLERSLKEQKLNTVVLAQEIKSQRKLLMVKEQIIKKLQTDKDLLEEQLRHIKSQQFIMNKNKASQAQMDNMRGYEHRYRDSKVSDQNQLKLYDLAGQLAHNHYRHASNNPQKTAYSYRSSVKHGDDNDFQQFTGKPKNYGLSRQKAYSIKGLQSLENTEKEYYKFMEEKELHESRRARRGWRRRQGML